MRGFDYKQDRLYFITSCVKDRACVFGDIVPLIRNNQGQFNSYPQNATHQMILNPCGMIARQQWYWLERQYPYVRLHAFIVMPNHVHGILEINRDLLYDLSPNHLVGTVRDLSLQDDLAVQDGLNHENESDHCEDRTDHRNVHTNYRDVRSEQVGTGRDLSLPVPIMDVPTIHDPSVDNPTMDVPIFNDSSIHDSTINDPSMHDSTMRNPTNHDPIITDSSTSSPSILQPGIKIKSLSELIGAYKTTSSKLIRMWQAPDGTYPYKDFQWQRSFHDHIIWNKEEHDHITFYIHNNPSAWFKDKFFQ